MRVLVTGASGMVGRNLVSHPRASEHELLAVSSRELDLLSFEQTSGWLAQHRPDLVIHCAGKVGGIQANIADPVGFLVQNADMGRNIVMAARAQGVQKLINLGSSCMYPRLAENPLREEQIMSGALEPTNEGYALAKIVVARLCQYISATEPGLQYKTLIPCNIYGAHDKFDPAVSHLVPAVIRKLHDARASGADTVQIWGDGTARREFMFAADLAEGIWDMVGKFDQLPDTMNIGVGEDHSINTYYALAAEVVGWSGTFEHDLSKPAGMAKKLLSVEHQRALGWMPKTSLADGIRATYAFYLRSIGEGVQTS